MLHPGMICGVIIWHAMRHQQGLRKRLSLFAAVASTLLAAHPAGASTARQADHGAPAVRLAPDGWGSTRLDELQFVLDAVATEFGAHFPGRELGTVKVVPGEGSPFVLYERDADGAYVVQLSARHARWYQFVYQFSHELCHIYSNFDNKDSPESARGNQWFEESVCEAAALFTLRELSERWASDAPSPQWRTHAAHLRIYADHFLSEPHRRLGPATTLAGWFRANEADLHANPYYRDRNELVSNLLLPLFERNPEGWGAIGYLNHDRGDARKGFFDFLAAWHTACPDRYREVVKEIMAMFGTPPAETALAGTQDMPALAAH